MSAPAINLRAVSKVYLGAAPITAISDISLSVRAGERIAITGPSGSGKTTLLHILGTLDGPSSGTVELAGRSVAGLSDAELSALRGHYIGFVFQQFSLLPHRSALANVATGLLYRGIDRREREARARRALGDVGLADRLDHRPNELSGGEQQRVAIARAIAGRPLVLLADEPTGNLDSASGAQIVNLIAELASGGMAVIVVTHHPAVAAAMDRRVAISDGRLRSDTAALPAGNE